MAREATSRGAVFEILADKTDAPGCSSARTTPSPSKKKHAALQDLAVNRSQNGTPTKSLAADLEKLHIHGSAKALETILRSKKGRGLQARAPIGTDTFVAPLTAPDQKHAHFDIPPASTAPAPEQKSKALEEHPKSQAHTLRVTDPFAKEQLAKHRAGQFEWVLEVPVTSVDSPRRQRNRNNSDSDVADAAEARKFWFGCNVLHRRARSGGDAKGGDGAANTYTLIATPIEAGEDLIAPRTPVPQEEPAMETPSNATGAATKALPALPAGETTDSTRVSPKSLISGSEAGLPPHLAPPSPHPAVLRIEDSFEELDRLEDQFEAVDSIVHVERVPSPDKAPASAGGAKRPLKKTASTTRRPQLSKSGSVRARPGEVSRPGVAGGPTSRSPAKEDEKGGAKAAPKKAVARPASLAPPKPLAKSSRPSTMPTFELPGEAVARRLKEQRESRMSGIVTLDMPAAPSPQRVRSTRAPTRPTFELPGEAISRRKREEHEARLRAQQEEDRKRREFKARPIRNSIAPGSFPRETVASRARQTKTGAGENPGAAAAAQATATGSKRQSIVPSARPTLGVTGSNHGGAPPRGRGTTPGSPSLGQPSRATSTSTGSISGKRSTVSAEEAQQQKQRGKEIYSRDNSITAGREQERLHRETAAKAAREQAAERSRVLAAEWADKQKLRLKKVMPGSPSAAANVAVR